MGNESKLVKNRTDYQEENIYSKLQSQHLIKSLGKPAECGELGQNKIKTTTGGHSGPV